MQAYPSFIPSDDQRLDLKIDNRLSEGIGRFDRLGVGLEIALRGD